MIRVVREGNGAVALTGLSENQAWALCAGMLWSGGDAGSAERDADVRLAEDISHGLTAIGADG